MKSPYPKHRQIKKVQKSFESEFCDIIKSIDYEKPSIDDLSKLDWWGSYYFTWLIVTNERLSKFWCDGFHNIEIATKGKSTHEIVGNLDMLTESEQRIMKLKGVIDIDQTRQSFKKFIFVVTYEENEYVLKSKD